MALFDDFINGHADEMFTNGLSFRAVADTLRGNGLSFSDSKLREFRDTISGSRNADFSNFGAGFEITDAYFTPSKDLPTGEYGIVIEITGINKETGKEVTRRSFERIDSFSTIQDFLDGYANDIIEAEDAFYGTTVSSIIVSGGYIGI